jgi:hypothetical protein
MELPCNDSICSVIGAKHGATIAHRLCRAVVVGAEVLATQGTLFASTICTKHAVSLLVPAPLCCCAGRSTGQQTNSAACKATSTKLDADEVRLRR